MRFRLLLVLAATLACARASKPPAAVPEADPGRDGRRLTVVGINDTHGSLLPVQAPRTLASVTKSEIGGADWLAGYFTALRADAKARGDEVVVLDAGDAFQGTLISNEFRGRSVVDVYNVLGVAAAAIGNHDFDFGLPVLQERIAQSKFPWLAANVFLKGTRNRPEWARPSVIVEIGGIRVGIVGLATRETPLVTNPVNVAHLDFVDGGPVAAEEADRLRQAGAQVVLVTAHMGPFPPQNEIQGIAEACKGKVDAIVSGHHHVAIGAKPGEGPLVVAGIPIVQSGSKLQNFSTIDLTLDAKNHVRGFTVNEGNLPKSGAPQAILHTVDGKPAEYRGHSVEPDAQVAGILRDYDVQVKKLRESTIGETTVKLEKANPGQDDLLANLTSDALRSGAGGALKADFGFQNSGGLRIPEIPAGPITFGQIFDLYPFDNEQVVVSVSADQLRAALESVLRAGKNPLRPSGIRYTIDWEKFHARDLKAAAPLGAMVTRILDDKSGKVLCETKSCGPAACEPGCAAGTFTVSLTDFLANGGDGLDAFKDAPRQVGPVLARDIIVAYVKEHRPLTAKLLGSTSAGAPPRLVVNGTGQRAQTD